MTYLFNNVKQSLLKFPIIPGIKSDALDKLLLLHLLPSHSSLASFIGPTGPRAIALSVPFLLKGK
jgi:hypothetical protein